MRAAKGDGVPPCERGDMQPKEYYMVLLRQWRKWGCGVPTMRYKEVLDAVCKAFGDEGICVPLEVQEQAGVDCNGYLQGYTWPTAAEFAKHGYRYRGRFVNDAESGDEPGRPVTAGVRHSPGAWPWMASRDAKAIIARADKRDGRYLSNAIRTHRARFAQYSDADAEDFAFHVASLLCRHVDSTGKTLCERLAPRLVKVAKQCQERN